MLVVYSFISYLQYNDILKRILKLKSIEIRTKGQQSCTIALYFRRMLFLFISLINP